MLRFEMNADSIRAIEAAWRQAPEIVQDELRRFVTTTTAHIQGEVQERTPTTFGTLRDSIIGDVRTLPGLGFEGVVGSSLAYAVPVELGTKPHMPPIAPLVQWAQQKLALRGAEAKRAAWGIARKIAARGTDGHFMFRDTFEANQAQVVRGFDVVVRRIAARIAGGASA